jgi:F-type H+-transporting ATPase subunit delta
MTSTAPRYARAFAQVAEASHIDVAAAQQQLLDFAETLADSHQLRELLGNPSIEMARKLRILDAIAQRAEILPQVRNFLAVILEHHRLAELDEIRAEYAKIVDAHSGAVEARIISARPLSPSDREQMEAEIAKLAGAQVRATYAEDVSLLGGAVVEIGSTIYDGSLRAQLQQLKHKLVNA